MKPKNRKIGKQEKKLKFFVEKDGRRKGQKEGETCDTTISVGKYVSDTVW